jgi:hypothetical protein
MKAEDWIKVEVRLPECTFGDRATMHYSRNVLVAMRYINGCSSYWVIRIACYDKILDQWLDHNEVPYEDVEYWMPIVLPLNEEE